MRRREGTIRIETGAVIPAREVETVSGERFKLPDGERAVHLQFRRFAGCPFCHLHLRSVVARHADIAAAGLREVVVFHSPAGSLRAQQPEPLPFAVVADPDKRLYREFGVESSPRSVLDPRAWPAEVRGLRAKGRNLSLDLHGGPFGLPADFLIAPDGRVLERRYGEHAYDQWSVDELLDLARRHHAGA